MSAEYRTIIEALHRESLSLQEAEWKVDCLVSEFMLRDSGQMRISTKERLFFLLKPQRPHRTQIEVVEIPEWAKAKVEEWLAQGQAVGRFINEDMGHHDLGNEVWMPFGEVGSLLARWHEGAHVTLPDEASFKYNLGPGWRYCLNHVIYPEVSNVLNS